MQSFSNAEFMQWAKDKKLSFISQNSWSSAAGILPPDEAVLNKAVASHVNLYENVKKEIFLAIFIVPEGSDPLVLVFKHLAVLK
jgi:hypothetical protein